MSGCQKFEMTILRRWPVTFWTQSQQASTDCRGRLCDKFQVIPTRGFHFIVVNIYTPKHTHIHTHTHTWKSDVMAARIVKLLLLLLLLVLSINNNNNINNNFVLACICGDSKLHFRAVAWYFCRRRSGPIVIQFWFYLSF